MKMRPSPLLAAAFVTLHLIPPAPAATIYSGYQGITVPSTFAGVYLDIDALNPVVPANQSGWDINPFFSGEGIANSAAFQPVRIGTGNLDRVLNLAPGTVISASLTYSSGFGGSGSPNAHIGAGTDQFLDGVEGYLGFKFTKNDASGPFYGWMRVTPALNGGAAMVTDWAYDNVSGGGTIFVGRVRQSAAVANAQTVTLSPGTGESFTLGSAVTDTGGNTNSLLKSGDGTTTLITSNTFTGATTVSDGTLNVGAAGALGSTASLAVNTGGTLLLSGTGDRINDTAGLTLAGGTFNTAGNSETVGALTLSGSSIIDMGSVASLLTFTSVGHTAWSGTLSIWNWNGSWTGGGSDQLLFLSNANNGNVNLSNVQFYSDSGFTPIGFGAGFVSGGTELVPVPEPSGIFVGLAMLGIAGWRERRRAKLAGRADRHTPSLPVSIPVLTVSGAPGAKANS